MHKTFLMVLTGVLAAASCLAAEEAAPAPAAAPAKSIGVIAVGQVDAALVDRVATFVRNETQLPVRVLPAREPVGKALADEAAGVAEAMTDADVCVVALVDAEGEDQPALSMAPAERVALVNARALLAGAADDEAGARRLEKEAMRSVGALLGAAECPNQQCALWNHGTAEELDLKSRSFCPPCLQKVQDLGKGRGLPVTDRSVNPAL